MPDVVIENPVINSPFKEPTKYFEFGDEGITNVVRDGRRISQYFMPIPQAQRKSAQLSFEAEWISERIEENKFINQVRAAVSTWRRGGYLDVTKTTRKLLDYWQREGRERRLFFCQIEALETAIYMAEVAKKRGDMWIDNAIRRANEEANPGLFRLAFKMATGSGKTLVMAMLIAWQTLNKLANPQDARFGDAFLIVTPGITIRDRLRVLLPNDANNYYRVHDLVPPDLMDTLNQAKILITNYHAFNLREKVAAGKLTKSILAGGDEKDSPFTETPDQMVRRVCRELGNKKNVIVINDEAHHCYRRKPDGEEEKLSGEDKQEAKQRDDTARVWISGLEAVKNKIGIRAIYDLSATPFFLRGSGWPEGALFQWVVSDFSLIDAIEAGIVKVPRVPVSDDMSTGNMPIYRFFWDQIRDHLPKKKQRTDDGRTMIDIPLVLDGAIRSLYGHYEQSYKLWEADTANRARGQTPPVFIIVCNNTTVSKLVFDYIAGWEKTLSDGSTVLVPGALPFFSNVMGEQWTARPNTILVDSEQLESGEAMSDDFKRIAAREIDEFKAEYRLRYPGRDTDSITDEDLLREVMNTVGKRGKLGEQIKCVVSVSMLTEGWDANTVTHILGVRAFHTQLLCEQVVGRGLRRMSYATNADGMFAPEYAEVYGVPFSFIPTAGGPLPKDTARVATRVRALDDRIACEIEFPHVVGYRYQLPSKKLTAKFSDESYFPLTTKDIPVNVTGRPIVGESTVYTLEDLKQKRDQEVVFLLAKLVLEKYFRQDGIDRPAATATHTFSNEVQAWLFPQVLKIAKEWYSQYVFCGDKTFPQLLLLIEHAHNAADKIYQAIVKSNQGDARLVPIMRSWDPLGSTRGVDFDTTREVYPTDRNLCHVSHVVADSSWESKTAQVLEEMEEVIRYVKNQGLGFAIPYTIDGQEHNYLPDFIIHLNDGHGQDDSLKLILEISGEAKREKAVKVQTARNLWVPAVNNTGQYGRWSFLEVTDPWDAMNTIRAHVRGSDVDGIGSLFRLS